MNYQTELMREILTNEKAQEIIDYVSQIYGNSYVGLWLFQAIGTVLGEVYNISSQLRYETSPATASLLLGYFEQTYGLDTDSTLTVEQRRNRLLAKIQSAGACTPYRLANAVSEALGGAPVEVYEHTGTNEFTVAILQSVDSVTPALTVIERLKPAHLICVVKGVIGVNATTDVNVATAMTYAEMYSVNVQGEGTISDLAIRNGELVILNRNVSTGVTTITKVSNTQSNGTVTLTNAKIKATGDGNGTVKLTI